MQDTEKLLKSLEMNKIENPVFKIIKTFPSSSGIVDMHIVVYEQDNYKIWQVTTENEIAENIYESGEYKGIYIIHSTSTMGAEIKPLNHNKTFSLNRTNCDSILTYHCLAIKIEENIVTLRTGFHEQINLNNSTTIAIHNWESMNNISNDYQEIIMNKDIFFSRYNAQIEKWKADNKV